MDHMYYTWRELRRGVANDIRLLASASHRLTDLAHLKTWTCRSAGFRSLASRFGLASSGIGYWLLSTPAVDYDSDVNWEEA